MTWPTLRNRRSIRLRGHDYTQAGVYFVTICTHDRARIFGDVVDGTMHLNAAGTMIAERWQSLSSRFSGIIVDEFVVMPNHMHGLIVLSAGGLPRIYRAAPFDGGAAVTVVGAPVDVETSTTARIVGIALHDGRARGDARGGDGWGAEPERRFGLGDIVGAFKSETTVLYCRGVREAGWPAFRGRLWHRNYYERILRSTASLDCVRRYIRNNPAAWWKDRAKQQYRRPHEK